MTLSKREVNRQRELMNYEYTHLYNVVRYGTQKNLPPVDKQIKEIKAGADPAEYGVTFVTSKGKKVTQRLSTLEKAQEAAQIHGGYVVRLGGSPRSPYDMYKFKPEVMADTPVVAEILETGTVEFVEQPLEGDKDFNAVLSLALNEMGAIQYKGTRPEPKALLGLHKRHPDVSFEDFAAAVIRHCEIPPPKRGGGSGYPSGPFRSYEEKENWYSTPAGQQWLRTNSVPAIMTHIKEDYFEWKSQEQREL